MSESRAAPGPRVAVTGAGGMLGREIVRAAAARGVAILGWDRAALDVTDAEAVRRIVNDTKPDVVLHAAAWTDVDGSEADPERAFRVNARGTMNLAAACREAGARLVTVSTDYVFPGDKDEPWREGDAASPLSVYGWSKLAAEEATLALGDHGAVARTSWLYAEHGKNFLLTILRVAKEKESLDVVDDQRGCPTYAGDLAPALLDLAASGASGVFHLTNAGATTWCGFAREIVARAGRATRIVAVTTEQVPRPARRPKNSVLASTRLASAGVASLPAWTHAVGRCLANRNECDA